MARVSGGSPWKTPPRGFTTDDAGDAVVVAQGLAGNRVHNTYATESDYDRDGELGSIVHKANAFRPSDFEDVADGGVDFERED